MRGEPAATGTLELVPVGDKLMHGIVRRISGASTHDLPLSTAPHALPWCTPTSVCLPDRALQG